MHVPPMQRSPAAQAIPQAPQSVTVTLVSMQVPMQSVCPAEHVRMATHAPPAQFSVALHAWPHIPQWLRSVTVLTQPPPQEVCPPEQVTVGWQAPATQRSLAAQAWSHIPQWVGEVEVSTHPPPQRLSLAAHMGLVSTGATSGGGVPLSTGGVLLSVGGVPSSVGIVPESSGAVGASSPHALRSVASAARATGRKFMVSGLYRERGSGVEGGPQTRSARRPGGTLSEGFWSGCSKDLARRRPHPPASP